MLFNSLTFVVFFALVLFLHNLPLSWRTKKFNLLISFLPDSLFAFIEKEDLSLTKLLRHHIRLPDRAGVQSPPRLPPYFGLVERNRREHMWHRMETDTELQKEVQGIWQGLFALARPLPPDLLAGLRAGVIADVNAIRSRGGDVVFLRLPSTNWLREFENETAPRETHWDPLIEESGCIGIHFEDHDDLRDFQCPEWSHLTDSDAQLFSKRLGAILQATLAN